MTSRKHFMPAAALVMCAFICVGSTPALAISTCPIKPTRDGFVALRAQPDAKARLIGRMKVGDEVRGDWDIEDRNGWTFVIWYKSGDVSSLKSSGRGWVNRKLINWECG
jgi:hypothetical protein